MRHDAKRAFVRGAHGARAHELVREFLALNVSRDTFIAAAGPIEAYTIAREICRFFIPVGAKTMPKLKRTPTKARKRGKKKTAER